MGMDFIQKLPTPAEIREQYPVPPALAALKKQRDKEIADVLTGQSDKLLVIIGPCSADNEDAVCDYVDRLAKVNEKVNDRLLVIPRIYTNKPRTTGEGYKGIVHQPDRSHWQENRALQCLMKTLRKKPINGNFPMGGFPAEQHSSLSTIWQVWQNNRSA